MVPYIFKKQAKLNNILFIKAQTEYNLQIKEVAQNSGQQLLWEGGEKKEVKARRSIQWYLRYDNVPCASLVVGTQWSFILPFNTYMFSCNSSRIVYLTIRKVCVCVCGGVSHAKYREYKFAKTSQLQTFPLFKNISSMQLSNVLSMQTKGSLQDSLPQHFHLVVKISSNPNYSC